MGNGCCKASNYKDPEVRQNLNRPSEKREEEKQANVKAKSNSSKKIAPVAFIASDIPPQTNSGEFPESSERAGSVKVEAGNQVLSEPKKQMASSSYVDMNAPMEVEQSADSSFVIGCEEVPNQYTVLVWAKAESALAEFYSSREIFYQKEKVSFVFYPTTSSVGLPKVIDCAMFLVTDVTAESQSIKEIKNRMKMVWNCRMVGSSTELSSLSQSLNIRVASTVTEALESFYVEDCKFTDLIKEVFAKLDKDQSGLIDAAEMKEAAKILGLDYSETEIQELIQDIDQNKDGQINFNEFVHWWRRGRLGATSVKKIIGGIASRMAGAVPGADLVLKEVGLKKRGINRKTRNKQMTIAIGDTPSRLSIGMFLGKGMKREQVLNEANTLLEFQKQENWAAIKLKMNREASTELLQELMRALQAYLSASMADFFDGEQMHDHWGVKAVFHMPYLYIGIYWNLDHPKFESEMNKILSIQEFWKTPVDDYVKVNSCFQCGLKELLAGDLLANINHGALFEIESETWTQLPFIAADLVPKTAFILVLLAAGKASMQMPKLNSLPSIPVEDWLRRMQGFPVLKIIGKFTSTYIEDQLQVLVRCNNFGASAEINSDDLTALLL